MKREHFRKGPQDYITVKQCLFLPRLKFFLHQGISKTGEIWKIERCATNTELTLKARGQEKRLDIVQQGLEFTSTEATSPC